MDGKLETDSLDARMKPSDQSLHMPNIRRLEAAVSKARRISSAILDNAIEHNTRLDEVSAVRLKRAMNGLVWDVEAAFKQPVPRGPSDQPA